MHEIVSEQGNLIRVDVSGKLTRKDYQQLIAAWDALISREGSMRMLLVMQDFHGWEVGAAWDDLRFGMKHVSQIERVAMVGEKFWQKCLAKVGALIMTEKVKYFDSTDLAAAGQWVRA
jgi:stage II sporulation SpoAA-like protein